MENLESRQNELEILRAKYDAKNNGEVREIRKKLIMEKNPNIIKELGDQEWIAYLYNTPIVGELERYKEFLLKGLEKTKDSMVDPNPEFNPSTGELSSGFLNEEEKESAINIYQQKIQEVDLLLNQ